jgi:spore coat protein H
MIAVLILAAALFTGTGCTESELVIPEPTDEVAFMFNENTLRTIALVLAPENLEFLDADPAAEEYVEGSVNIDGVQFDQVGIRYKGSIGGFWGCTEGGDFFNPSGRKTCLKLSMKVRFDEYLPDQRFFGVKRLQLHAMRGDPSMLAERLSYSLYRDMGIAAPRTNHVRLLINGEYLGVFLLVEQIDGQFVRSRFTEGGKGNLYKEAWPITPDENYYLGQLRTNRDENLSAHKMIAFYQDIQADPDDAAANWLNVDYMMGYLAVDRAIQNDDGIMHFYCFGGYCGNHNYYWYEEVDNDGLWLIPWDLDPIAFSDPNPLAPPGDWRDVYPDCTPVPTPFPGVTARNPACDSLIYALARYPDLYKIRQQEFLEGPFRRMSVEEKLDTWRDLIRNAVIEAHATDPEHIAVNDWENQILWRKYTLTEARERLAADIAE